MNIELLFKVLVKEVLDVYNSGFFKVVKVVLGVYALIVFVDIILLIIQRGFFANLRTATLGTDMPVELTTKKDRLKKRWNDLRKRLETGKETEYKVAIIEADSIIDDLLKRMQYAGENLGERLAGVPAGQLENVADMREAHEARNKIVLDGNFKLSKEEAEKTLEKFESLLRYFEVLD